MENFTLRNCKYNFVKCNQDIKSCDEEYNFFIHVYSEDDDDEIFNCISSRIYDKLIEFMNNNDNFSISFTQVEGTTTDFTIVKNKVFNNIDEMVVWTSKLTNSNIGYKYLIADFDKCEINRF